MTVRVRVHARYLLLNIFLLPPQKYCHRANFTCDVWTTNRAEGRAAVRVVFRITDSLSPSTHTHTQTHTRIYAAYTAAKTPMHFLHMQSHSYIHPHFGPPSHTLCSRCLNLSNTFIDALLHRVISTARQKIRRDLTAIQINPPLSCSECWCQNIPPNRLGQRTCSLSKN